MRGFLRWPRRARAAALRVLALATTLAIVVPARADHGGASRAAPMSPALVGVLAAVLALAAGLLVVVIVMRLTRKHHPPGQAPSD